jgi:hypothetical protein
MPALVAGIHRPLSKQGVDGRDEPGHDEEKWFKVTGICVGAFPAVTPR